MEKPPASLVLAEEVWGAGLHAIRSLRALDSKVHVAVAGSGAEIYRRSNACAAAIDVPVGDGGQFCAAVIDWMGERVAGDVVVIPLSDRLVEVLHEHREVFPEHFTLCIPEPEITAGLLDKSRSLAVAADAGLNVPQWVVVTEANHLDRLAAIGGAIALRPTKWSTSGEEYFKISVHHDLDDARVAARLALSSGAELIAQQYIDAPEDCVEFAVVWRSHDRSRTAVCTGRKRRQSAPDGGVMVWGQAEPLRDVDAAARAFLDHSGFTGPGGIEFIRDGDDLRFIEFNPRSEAIHFLASAAGIDTIALTFRDRGLGQLPAQIPAQVEATAWVGGAWLTRVLSDRHYRLEALRDRLRFAASPNRTKAVVKLDDPVPASAVLLRLLRRGVTRSVPRRTRAV